MSEKVKVLMERFYKVPEPTANEVKLYERHLRFGWIYMVHNCSHWMRCWSLVWIG